MTKLAYSQTANSPTLRSIIIGLLLVILFCAVIPYNDFYIEGTFLAGNRSYSSSFYLLLTLC